MTQTTHKRKNCQKGKVDRCLYKTRYLSAVDLSFRCHSLNPLCSVLRLRICHIIAFSKHTHTNSGLMEDISFVRFHHVAFSFDAWRTDPICLLNVVPQYHENSISHQPPRRPRFRIPSAHKSMHGRCFPLSYCLIGRGGMNCLNAPGTL